jgi:hypothetical protein
MSSKNKSSALFNRSSIDPNNSSRTPKYCPEKYSKKFDSKSSKTWQKKKRQYKEFKPSKAPSSGNATGREGNSNSTYGKKNEKNYSEHSGLKSFKTPEKGEQKNRDQSEETPTFLLIKNLGSGVSEENVRELVGKHVSISSLKIVKNSNNVYLKCEQLQQIHRLIKEHEKHPLMFRNKKVKMCLVNKLPLDLNQKSKICKKLLFVLDLLTKLLPIYISQNKKAILKNSFY